MKLETRFSCGDCVYPIGQERKQVVTVCAICQGAGRITAGGKGFTCPECYGRGDRTNYEPQAWQICQSHKFGLTIGQVRVEHTDSRGSSDVFDNYKDQKGHKEEYMCNETGVGSGSVWNGEHLFATKEEAQAECDRLNSLKDDK